MKSSTRFSISTFSLVADVIAIIILNACDTKFKQNCLATCQSKDMSEDVVWCWFTTFKSPDSLSDAVSAQFPSTSSYFPVFGCFKWVKVLYQVRWLYNNYWVWSCLSSYFIISWETYLCINSLKYHAIKSSHVMTIYRFKVIWPKARLKVETKGHSSFNSIMHIRIKIIITVKVVNVWQDCPI